uniref:Phospholipase A2 n=1 Tax=Marmota marmota marmota TaxID=9994 RepID=A0A8C6A0Z6_MARMA
MRTLLALAVIMVFGLMWVQGDLFNFNSMISSVTKKNGATNYGAYGCHCGLGGKGTPKDATDRCCASHDCCYKRLEKRGCGTKSLSYRFKYQAGKVICEGKKALYPVHFPCFICSLKEKRKRKMFYKRFRFKILKSVLFLIFNHYLHCSFSCLTSPI